MRQADNVMVRRPNVIEPRPGFGKWPNPSTGSLPTTTPSEVTEALGDVFVFSENASTGQRDLRAMKSEKNFSDVGSSIDSGYYGTSFVEAGEAFYFTTSTGVKRVSGLKPSDTVSDAGLEALDSCLISTTFSSEFAISFTYADKAAREGASVVADDVGKYALQSDDGTIWRLTSNTPSWLEQQTMLSKDACSVAYRVVIRRDDGNGRVRRSNPSGRAIIRKDSSLDGKRMNVVFYNITLPPWVKAGDTFEFYRSPVIATDVATPSDEMFLSMEVKVTDAMVAAKVLGESVGGNAYRPAPDNTLDSALGAALYTNASQFGIGKANMPPPMVSTMSEFQGCVFSGNVTYPYSKTLKIKDIAGATTGASAPEAEFTGLQMGTVVGRIGVDAGSGGAWAATKTVSQITDISGLKVGMAITDVFSSLVAYEGPWSDSTHFYADTIIEAIETVGTPPTATYNLLLSKAVKATNATPTTVAVYDSVAVDGVPFYYTFPTGDSLAPMVTASSLGSYKAFTGLSIDVVSERLAWAITSYFTNLGTSAVAASVYRDVKGEITIGLYRPHMSSDPYTTEISVTNTRSSEAVESEGEPAARHKPSRVIYSRPDLPGACPVLNHIDVGRSSARVLALEAGEESIYVFKEDGIWRISGFPTDSWRVDKVSHARLLHPKATCVLDSTVYAWTDRGVMSLTGPGALPISDQFIGESIADKESLYAGSMNSGGAGTFMVASPSLGAVILALPSDIAQDASEEWWVFCVKTGAWTRWDMMAYAACYSHDGAPPSDPDGTALPSQKSSGQLVFAKKSYTPDPTINKFDLRAERVVLEGTFEESLSSDAIFGWGIMYTPLAVPLDISGSTVTADASSVGQWIPRAHDVVSFGTPDFFSVVGNTTLSTEEVVTAGGDTILTLDGSTIFDDTVDSYSFVLDGEPGITSTSTMFVWEGFTSEVMFQAHVGNPHKASNWRNMQVHLQECGKPSFTDASVHMGASNEWTTAPKTVTAKVLKTDEEIKQTRPVVSLVPRDVRRSATLYPYFRVAGSGWKWASAGITLEYNKKGRPSR